MTTPGPAPDNRTTGAVPRSRRTVLLLGLVAVAVLVAVATLAGPPSPTDAYDPRGTGPSGLAGVIDLLERSGVETHVSTDLPTDMSTRVFVPTPRSATQEQEIRDWVERGGTAVVAGPSRIHDLVPLSGPFQDLFGATAAEPACDVAAVREVRTIEHAGWGAFQLPDDAHVACFPAGDDTAWLVARDLGDGTVVAIGSPAPFTNAYLARADNASLAAALLGPRPGASVVVMPPPAVGEGETDVLDLIPGGVWRALALLTVALLVAILWQARRLGRPVEERLPPVLPGAELTRSVAGLLHRAGDHPSAAARLRADIRRRAARSLGMPRSTPTNELVGLVSRRTGLASDLAELALLDRPVRSNEELVAVARACHDLRHALAVPEPHTPGKPSDPGRGDEVNMRLEEPRHRQSDTST